MRRQWSKKGYLSQLPCPPPEDLPNPGIELRSSSLQTDSLPSESPRKPKNTGVDSLSLLQVIFLTQELNKGLLHCRQILYQLSYQGSPIDTTITTNCWHIRKTVTFSIIFSDKVIYGWSSTRSNFIDSRLYWVNNKPYKMTAPRIWWSPSGFLENALVWLYKSR